MLEGHEGSDIRARDVGGSALYDNHSLLLSLAGLIDDELLGWSRELAAVGEFDHALELITATIAAEDVRLPEPVHAALVAAQRGNPAVELPGPEKGPVPPHRFLADPAAAGYPAAVADSSPVEALRGLPGRLLRGCRLWLSWRLTPAGAAPTPVPHPVLLIETSDGAGADLLAYQVADLLGRSGAFVSVEVFGPDSVVGDYHRAALDASTALDDLEFTGASVKLDSPEDTASSLAAQSPLGPPPLPQRESRESGGRPPLQPVERVMAARASAPRNPIDNVMPFERSPQERPPADRPFPDRPLFDRGGPAGLDRPPGDRPGFAAFDDGFGSGAQRPVPPRDRRPRDEVPPLGPARPANAGPVDWSGPPQGPAGPPPMPPKGPMTGAFPAPGSGPQGPGSGPQGPGGPGGPPAMAGPPSGSMSGAFPAQPIGMTGPNAAQPGPNPGPPPRPMDRRPPERNGMPPRNGAGPDRNGIERTAMMPERGPGPDRNGLDRNGLDRNGMGRNGAPGAATRAVPPVPPPVSQPTARQPAPPPPPKGAGPQGPGPQGQQGPGPQGQQGPGPQGPAQGGPGQSGPGPVGTPGQPQRPPLRPADLPELPDGLSDVEQKLLRQLHEELAAREDGPSTAGQVPRGAYRNGSNGSARPPQKPMGPPSDQSS